VKTLAGPHRRGAPPSAPRPPRVLPAAGAASRWAPPVTPKSLCIAGGMSPCAMRVATNGAGWAWAFRRGWPGTGSQNEARADCGLLREVFGNPCACPRQWPPRSSHGTALPP